MVNLQTCLMKRHVNSRCFEVFGSWLQSAQMARAYKPGAPRFPKSCCRPSTPSCSWTLSNCSQRRRYSMIARTEFEILLIDPASRPMRMVLEALKNRGASEACGCLVRGAGHRQRTTNPCPTRITEQLAPCLLFPLFNLPVASHFVANRDAPTRGGLVRLLVTLVLLMLLAAAATAEAQMELPPAIPANGV